MVISCVGGGGGGVGVMNVSSGGVISVSGNSGTGSYTTIDEKHTEIMNGLKHEEETVLPQLLQEKRELKCRLGHLKTKDKIDERLLCLDELAKLKEKIVEIRNNRKKYLLDNCTDLFHYFEERKKVSSGNNNQNSNKVKNFFKIKTASSSSAETDAMICDKYEKSRNIYNNYWRNINNTSFNMNDYIVPTGVCTECNVGELIVQEEDGVIMCNQCFQLQEYIMDSSKPSSKEIPNEVSYTAYIRLNHFKEILSQFQAKETTQIPKEVIEKIKNRIKKERIQNIQDIDNKTMRDILRRLRLNKYYEHIQYINSLLGIRPPIMSEKLIETLEILFLELQNSWSICCPLNRRNFFNYSYTLYQLCVLLNQTEYLKFIPMLKDITIQKEQDMIWKKMCSHLDWVYNPTV